jgi:hypothetical protein
MAVSFLRGFYREAVKAARRIGASNNPRRLLGELPDDMAFLL